MKNLLICVLENIYLSVHPEHALALQSLNKAYAVRRRMTEAGTTSVRAACLPQPPGGPVPT